MDSYGRNELHYLITDSPVETHTNGIESLLSNGLDVNSQDDQGWSPLHFAAQEQSLPAIQSLLRNGANTEVTDSYGNTPLHKAVYFSKDNLEIIAALINSGANPNKENNHGVTPKSLAETIGNSDITAIFE